MNLYGLAELGETGSLGFLINLLCDARYLDFLNIAAMIADDQLGIMPMLRMPTDDKRIQRFNTMYKTVLAKKFKCPVDRYDLRLRVRFLQIRQQFIGAYGPVLLGHQAQYLAPNRRQAQLSVLAYTGNLVDKGAEMVPSGLRHISPYPTLNRLSR